MFRRKNKIKKFTSVRSSSYGLFGINKLIKGKPHISSKILESDRVRQHEALARKRRRWTIFGLLMALLLLVCLVIYNFTAHVTVTTTTDAVTEPYQEVIDDYLNKHPFERVRFVLNKTELLSALQDKTPEVAAVISPSYSGIGHSTFGVIFRKPVASWKIGSTTYYVDKTGVSFSVNHFTEPSIKITDESGITPEEGSTLVSNRFLGYVGRMVEFAGQSGIVIQKVIIPFDTTRQVDVIIKGESYRIKMSIDRPIGEQVEDVANAVAYFKSKKKPQYIDVRVPSKAFWR